MTDNQVQPQSAGAPGADTGGQPADDECTDCLPQSRRDDFAFTGCGCGDCDSASLEILCRAEGIKARAAYDAAHAGAPSPELYESARLAYGESRYTLAPVVADLEEKIDDALEEIRCRIDDDDKISCLKSSWKEVRRRLRACRVDGCCVDDYKFRLGPDDAEVGALKARVARYTSVTEAAEKCFARLAREPELVVARVDELAAEITAIHLTLHPDEAPPAPTPPATPAAETKEGAAAGENADEQKPQEEQAKAPEPAVEAEPAPAKPDWQHLYASALVAAWKLKNVYWGFDDPKAYVECLCQAMKVAMAGHQVLAELYGELRIREARSEQRNTCCRRLREHAANEVISGYIRCIREGCGPDEPESRDDDCDDEDCDDETHHHKRRPGRDRRPSKRRRRDHRDHDRRDDDDDDDDDDIEVKVRVDVEVDDDDDDDDDDYDDGRRHDRRGGERGRRDGRSAPARKRSSSRGAGSSRD